MYTPTQTSHDGTANKGSWLRFLPGRRQQGVSNITLREALEDYIEDAPDPDSKETNSTSAHEKILLTNILKLRDLTAGDVMVPRTDIVAVEKNINPRDLLTFLAEKRYSRVPVYKETLDDILGILHVKDILVALSTHKNFEITDLIRPAQIIAPSMRVLDVLLNMRRTRRHMALIVDEFGGIDGLITIGDITEAIVGEAADEHDPDETSSHITREPNGAILADARMPLVDFESRFGPLFTPEERQEADTLGGLVFFLTGRVPTQGENIVHATSGITLEVAEAAGRRIAFLRITNLPSEMHTNQE